MVGHRFSVVSECFMNLGTIVDLVEKNPGSILPHPPRRQCLCFFTDEKVKNNLGPALGSEGRTYSKKFKSSCHTEGGPTSGPDTSGVS